MLQISEKDIAGIGKRIAHHVARDPQLAEARDSNGRSAVNVATPTNIQAINSVILIHGRYRLRTTQPAHQSATCIVYEAFDEGNIDANGHTVPPVPVALKFMSKKLQFIREVSARGQNFSPHMVIDIIRTHPETKNTHEASSLLDRLQSLEDDVPLPDDTSKQLPKEDAEKLYCLVMNLADRNLFVAIKQERFAGRNMDTVRYITKQLIACLEHMHSKGVLHADIKPLNIMRIQADWCVIDLDAVCRIDIDSVGFKSSSGYIPPEAVFVNNENDVAVVRSEQTNLEYGCDVLIAHPSFDIWSVACILYQLVNSDVLPLFVCGQDDNL